MIDVQFQNLRSVDVKPVAVVLMLPVPVYPPAELVKVLRTGIFGNAAEGPRPHAVVQGDAHRPVVATVVRRRGPLHDSVVASRPLPIEIPRVAEHLHNLHAGEIACDHSYAHQRVSEE